MTQLQLLKRLSKALGVTQLQTDDVLRSAFELIEKAVRKTGRFEWKGFGVFLLRHRKARRILTPAGKPMRLPAASYIGFRSSRSRSG